ncbi:hypothetical protein L207DRAFT_571888 [Hyaloscypha variabilis F]|uniref:Azaphilone pigments biosynthesis cluster protein L N-terminal domain-containing protein n=1 Tax=Hyaloscypha variabilis (strain UAMH 11265 / GT02V1 / F) TaxID=1149755 RepID=A0A2J6R234_HYAVF|nr:hypothetical protein L207DRAFT_571888 [Hyaloscypha variabilis F]
MDPLSGAASVFAVVSLALQLVDSVVTIRDFCKRFKGSKAQIDRLLADLLLLQAILESLAGSQQNLDTVINATPLYLALEQCADQIRPMKVFVDDLDSGRQTRRKRTALKTALSTSKLAEFQAHLDSAKLTLNTCIGVTSLLFSYANREAILLQLNDMHLTIKSNKNDRIAISEGLVNPSDKGPIPHNQGQFSSHYHELVGGSCVSINGLYLLRWVPRSLWPRYLYAFVGNLGRIEYKSREQKRIRRSSDPGDLETVIIGSRVLFAMFPIIRTAFTYRASAVYGNWSHSLRVHSILPCDALVWGVCKSRNLLELKRILSSGEVSPFVLNPDGASLLHYAAAGGSIEMIKMLLEVGLDCNSYAYFKNGPSMKRAWSIVSWSDRHPLDCISWKYYDMKSTERFEEMIETIRTFFLRPDFDPELVHLQFLGQDLATTKWLLSQDYQPLPQRFLDWTLHELCYLDRYDDGTGEEWAEVVLQALKRGANIHNCEGDTWWTSVRPWGSRERLGLEIGRETPLDTFLSRSREGDAATWLQVLDKFGINLQEYAKEEQELHDFNHRVFQTCEGGCGIRKVKYCYSKSTPGRMEIRLGSLLDWETAFHYSARSARSVHDYYHDLFYDNDDNLFCLSSLFKGHGVFDGYLEDESDDDDESEKLEAFQQDPSIFRKAYLLLSKESVWLYWIMISLICHLYLHFWVLPWFRGYSEKG